jgi:hypothetical protein
VHSAGRQLQPQDHAAGTAFAAGGSPAPDPITEKADVDQLSSITVVIS